jgi:hypothetical protein
MFALIFTYLVFIEIFAWIISPKLEKKKVSYFFFSRADACSSAV